MKTNKLKIVYVLISAIFGALLFGGLVGGIDSNLSSVATVISFVGAFALAYGYSPRDQKSMAMTCGAITSGITLSCTDPLSAGVVATFYIANKADIASITYDNTNPMLATDITMVATKTFFTVEGQLQSTEPTMAMIKGTYVNQFEHSVKFLIFKIDPATKQQVLNMKDGNFVCIIENNYTGSTGNSKYEIYGAGTGLKAEVIERNPADAETLGAYSIELKTQEYAREVKPPVALFDTDLATTDALVQGLI
jgi:hypothetical protein